VNAAPIPSVTKVPIGDDEEECEEYEVVPADAGDEIPFCDDL